MNMIKFAGLACAGILSTAVLSACGGGGGSGNSTTAAANTAATSQQPVTSFPLQAAYKTRVANGARDNFNVSGSCSGAATISSSAPAAATFEGAAALSVAGTTTITFTNCTPASTAATSTVYYDSNYNMLGHSTPGVEYAKFPTAPATLPTSVKVGDTAVYGTETVYTDSSKQTIKGQRTLSYVVEADGPSTAILNLITRDVNASNQLLFTQQTKYRISADGTLAAVTVDIQYSTTSTNHFVFTAK